MELVHDRDPARPDAALTKRIVAEAAEEGLLMLSCGIRGNVIRFLPALSASDAIIEEAMDRLERVLVRVSTAG